MRPLTQARFGSDRLRVQVQASAVARFCRLPALLLLAPLDNAVKHHLARQRGPVGLHLDAQVHEDRRTVRIINRGQGAAGMPIPMELAPDAGAARSGAGLGPRNLRQRVLAHHGATASVILGTTAGGMQLEPNLPAQA